MANRIVMGVKMKPYVIDSQISISNAHLDHVLIKCIDAIQVIHTTLSNRTRQRTKHFNI